MIFGFEVPWFPIRFVVSMSRGFLSYPRPHFKIVFGGRAYRRFFRTPRFVQPERSLDPEFVSRLNQAAQVMRKILHRLSLTIATSVLLLMPSPNFALIIENVASTFDRLW